MPNWTPETWPLVYRSGGTTHALLVESRVTMCGREAHDPFTWREQAPGVPACGVCLSAIKANDTILEEPDADQV